MGDSIAEVAGFRFHSQKVLKYGAFVERNLGISTD